MQQARSYPLRACVDSLSSSAFREVSGKVWAKTFGELEQSVADGSNWADSKRFYLGGLKK